LGEVTRSRFSRLNGKIKLDELKKDHIKMFGIKYLNQFTKNLEKTESDYLATYNISPKSAYNNVIVWRHQFVHEGTLPSTTNYAEIKDQYTAGKEVIHCLFKSMVR
jgi:RiboL-PSP-HEPN